MDATLTAPTALPDRDSLARELVFRLGDGGTMDQARAAVDWAIERFMPVVAERILSDLVGVREAASLIGQPRAVLLRWANGQGRTDMPEPVLTLDCGAHWSRTVLTKWRDTVLDHVTGENP